MEVLKDAWANYRDESFIEQFLSPKLMRDFRMFALHDKADDGAYKVSLHPQRSRAIAACAPRSPANTTSAQRKPTSRSPARISQAIANYSSSTACIAASRFTMQTRDLVCAHIERLWGHEVVFEEVLNEE